VSAAIAYHAATKYAPETIGSHPGLDWSRQPTPYKDYESLCPIELAPYLPFDPNPFSGGPRQPQGRPQDGEISLNTISRWLFAAYGITGVIPNQPRPTYLRAAPSAGGLYPAEIYLVVRECPLLPAGLYGYDPRRHQLVPLWEGKEVHQHLTAASFNSAAIAAAPVCLVLTGVFERSRWRYGERAYRRILLDSGHLLGNACLMAPALGLRSHLTTAFCDRLVGELLRVDPADEGPLALLTLSTRGAPERPNWAVLPSPLVEMAPGETASDQDDPSPYMTAVHRNGCLEAERPRQAAVADRLQDELQTRYGWQGGRSLEADLEGARDLGNLSADPFSSIVRRRSTRRFRRAAMARAQLARILAGAYAPGQVGLGEQPALDSHRLMTFVAAVAVDGLDSGVYYLAPHALELRLVRPGADRDALQYLCLSQELGGDAAVVVFHTADLQSAVSVGGDRAYRHLHLDAGLIGERLDLAALALGLGASGIGGFFDDQVTGLLGIPSEQAVVYITTIGVLQGAGDEGA
jgi:SagB-type dehydrogenase family enzyme